MKNNEQKVKIINRYSEALKRKIVEEISGGIITASEAMKFYGVKHRKTVNQWRQKYGDNPSTTKIVRIMMQSEKERIEELEKVVANLEITNLVKSAQLERYQHYVPDLKKKLSTKELKEFEANEKKIKGFR
jgi:transposase-like protein